MRNNLLRFFVCSLFFPVLYGAECSPELLKAIKTKDANLLECTVVRDLYKHEDKPTLNALIVEHIALNDETSEDYGLTVSLWVLKSATSGRQELELDHPIYRESQLGQELIEFNYKSEKTRLAVGDFNNDGTVNFAIYAYQGPYATLILKGHDPQRKKFENLGYRQNEQGQWNQFDYFVAGKESKIEIKANSIEIQLPNETMVYRLRGSQYEIEQNL